MTRADEQLIAVLLRRAESLTRAHPMLQNRDAKSVLDRLEDGGR